MMRSFAPCLLLLVACTERSPGGAASPQRPADAGPSPSARAVTISPSASSSTAVARADAEAAENWVAWTDPGGVRALLHGEKMHVDVTDPRACNFKVPEQSCVPNEQAVEWACKADCAKSCEDCATACEPALRSCRAPCKGDLACETRCGQTAGACVQSCLSARDRCYTGECVKSVARYREKWSKNFGCKSKLDPLEICNRTSACIHACQDKVDPSMAPSQSCIDGCAKTHAAGCERDFVDNATMGACQSFDRSL